MRILAVGSYPPPFGGVATVIKNIHKSELNKEYEMKVFNTLNKRKDKYLTKYVMILLFEKIFDILVQTFNFIHTLVHFKPHIVHIHVSYGWGWIQKSFYLLLSRFFSKRSILHIHAIDPNGGDRNSDYYFPIFWNIKYVFPPNFIFSIADAIIVESKILYKHMKKTTSNINLHLVPNGVFMDNFSSKSNFLETKVIYFLGGLYHEKGIIELIESFQIVRNKYDNCILVIAGNGPLKKIVEAKSKNKLDSKIFYLGKVSEKKKLALFSLADIFVLPSHMEELPLTILEAMSSSLPIIATKVGAIPEVVKDDVNGYLIEPKSSKILSDKMLALLQNSEKSSEFGINGYNKIKREYDMSHISKKLDLIYNSII